MLRRGHIYPFSGSRGRPLASTHAPCVYYKAVIETGSPKHIHVFIRASAKCQQASALPGILLLISPLVCSGLFFSVKPLFNQHRSLSHRSIKNASAWRGQKQTLHSVSEAEEKGVYIPSSPPSPAPVADVLTRRADPRLQARSSPDGGSIRL